MLFEEFIKRYMKLNEQIVFVFEITDDYISFRRNEASESFVKDLEDLLNTIVADKDGKFVVTHSSVIKFEFVEAKS